MPSIRRHAAVLGIGILVILGSHLQFEHVSLAPGRGFGPANIAVTSGYAFVAIAVGSVVDRTQTRASALVVTLSGVLLLIVGTFALSYWHTLATDGVVAHPRLLAVDKLLSGLLVSPIPMAYAVGVWERRDTAVPVVVGALVLYLVPLGYFLVVAQQFGGFLVVLGLVFLVPLSVASLPVFALGYGPGALARLTGVARVQSRLARAVRVLNWR